MTLPFLLNTKAEFLKCKNTAALWLTVMGAAFIPAVNVFKCISRPDYFIPILQPDPWKIFIEYNWQIAAFFLLIMYVILVTSLVVQIEFRNGTWKQVYSSPRSYADIFFSKFIAINTLVVGCFILFNFFIVVCGYSTAFIQERYSFFLHPVPWREMVSISVKMYTSVLAILVIQYWLSLRYANFIIPLGLGLALFTFGLMIRQWEHIDYYPYMYPFLVYFKNPGLSPDTAQKAIVNSALWSGAGLLLGFLTMANRKGKGK